MSGDDPTMAVFLLGIIVGIIILILVTSLPPVQQLVPLTSLDAACKNITNNVNSHYEGAEKDLFICTSGVMLVARKESGVLVK